MSLSSVIVLAIYIAGMPFAARSAGRAYADWGDEAARFMGGAAALTWPVAVLFVLPFWLAWKVGGFFVPTNDDTEGR